MKPKNKKSGKLTLVQQIQEKIQSMKNNIDHLENSYKKKIQQLGNILDISEGLSKLAYESNDYRKSKIAKEENRASSDARNGQTRNTSTCLPSR